MVRIALFGGSFDPPTLGHALTARNVLNSGLVDEVWFVPAGDDRYDRPLFAPGRDRREMVERLIAGALGGDKRIKLETAQLEGRLPGSATVHLLDFERELHPDSQFFFVVGADNIAKLSGWKEFERLKSMTRFLAVARGGEQFPGDIPPYVTVLEGGGTSDASSTRARELLSRGESTADVLSPEVGDFIAVRGLYKN